MLNQNLAVQPKAGFMIMIENTNLLKYGLTKEVQVFAPYLLLKHMR